MEVKLVKRDDHYGLYNEDGHKIAATLDGCNSKLSKQNCDEIFGVVDVEKLAMDWRESTGYHDADSYSYILGFNKAMELNKDKVFTLEDMRKAYEEGYLDEHSFEVVIQSLQQPTEIEVEIVMRPASLMYKSNLVIEELNSEGCLILQRKL